MSSPTEGIRIAGTAVVLRDGAEGLETLMLRRPAKGSFANAWVFPGGRVDDADRVGADGEPDATARAAIRETAEEAGIRIHALQLLSRWVPPPETPVRYRTWFFLAREHGDAVRPNPGEIEEAVWMSPREAFVRQVAGGFTLVPPTWVTLHSLLDFDTVDEAFAQLSEPALYETRLLQFDQGVRAVWAGDEEHPDAPGAAGARHRLSMGDLPWVYERS